MGRKTRVNTITSPELLAQVNPENTELLDDFIGYLRSIQRSETTIEAYKNDIEIAFVWSLKYNNNLPFVKWTKRQVSKYQNWLINENGNSPARVRRLKASLSSLANYVENILDDEYPGFRNIINKIESPANQPVREKTIWSEDEITSLLGQLVGLKKYEQACFLALAAYGGRRKSELCRFRVSDFDDSHLVCGGALYKSSPIKTKGRGLGKFIPCYTLAKKFKPYLDLWLDERRDIGIESEWLFPMPLNPGEHIQISTANSWAELYTRLSGKPCYLHSLRHLFTTSLAQAGIPDSVIQSLVAWESADMVRLYDDTSTDEMIGAYFSEGDINVPKQKGLSDL